MIPVRVQTTSLEFGIHRRRSRSISQLDLEEEVKYDFLAGAKEIFLGGPLNILLLAIPPLFFFSFVSSHPNQTLLFISSLLSLAPFAERLGYVTEQLSMHTNETIGGLLNATVTNITFISSHYRMIILHTVSDPSLLYCIRIIVWEYD